MQGGAKKTSGALAEFTGKNKKLDQSLSAMNKQGSGAIKTFRRLEQEYTKEKNSLAVLLVKQKQMKNLSEKLSTTKQLLVKRPS